MPAYGEKQQPAGKRKLIIERPLVSRKGIISKNIPYKGNPVRNANR